MVGRVLGLIEQHRCRKEAISEVQEGRYLRGVGREISPRCRKEDISEVQEGRYLRGVGREISQRCRKGDISGVGRRISQRCRKGDISEVQEGRYLRGVGREISQRCRKEDISEVQEEGYLRAAVNIYQSVSDVSSVSYKSSWTCADRSDEDRSEKLRTKLQQYLEYCQPPDGAEITALTFTRETDAKVASQASEVGFTCSVLSIYKFIN